MISSDMATISTVHIYYNRYDSMDYEHICLLDETLDKDVNALECIHLPCISDLGWTVDTRSYSLLFKHALRAN